MLMAPTTGAVTVPCGRPYVSGMVFPVSASVTRMPAKPIMASLHGVDTRGKYNTVTACLHCSGQQMMLKTNKFRNKPVT